MLKMFLKTCKVYSNVQQALSLSCLYNQCHHHVVVITTSDPGTEYNSLKKPVEDDSTKKIAYQFSSCLQMSLKVKKYFRVGLARPTPGAACLSSEGGSEFFEPCRVYQPCSCSPTAWKQQPTRLPPALNLLEDSKAPKMKGSGTIRLVASVVKLTQQVTDLAE